MAGYTKVMLIGNLTRDPELRTSPASNTPFVDLRLACTRRFTQNGEQREHTCFIDVRFFGRTADVLHQYVRKGQPLFVEGRLEYLTWTTPEGQKASKHRVVGESFQFLASRDRDREGGRGDRPAFRREDDQGWRDQRGGYGGRGRPGAGQESPAAPGPGGSEAPPEEAEPGADDAGDGGMDDVPF